MRNQMLAEKPPWYLTPIVEMDERPPRPSARGVNERHHFVLRSVRTGVKLEPSPLIGEFQT